MKVLSQRDLPAKGIPWSREHTRRMWKSGQFPKPFKLGGNWNYWLEDAIDDWLEKRAATAGKDRRLESQPGAQVVIDGDCTR